MKNWHIKPLNSKVWIVISHLVHTPQICATVAAFLQTLKINFMSCFFSFSFFFFFWTPHDAFSSENKDLSDNVEQFLSDCHIHMHQQKSAVTRQNVQFHCVDVFALLSSAFHCKVSGFICTCSWPCRQFSNYLQLVWHVRKLTFLIQEMPNIIYHDKTDEMNYI